MSVGEVEKQFAQHIGMIDSYYGEINWRDVLKIIAEARKDFPMKTLQFMDARYTDECEDFRKEVHDWFMKWFGEEAESR